MKKNAVLLSAIISLFIFSCQKENVSGYTSNEPALDKMITGNSVAVANGNGINTPAYYSLFARIGSYINDGNDETSFFKNYIFEFRSDNSIIIRGENKSFYGRWMYTTPDKLVLSFDFFVANVEGLAVLNDNWVIVEMNRNSLLLMGKAVENNGGGIKEKVRFMRFDLM